MQFKKWSSYLKNGATNLKNSTNKLKQMNNLFNYATVIGLNDTIHTIQFLKTTLTHKSHMKV